MQATAALFKVANIPNHAKQRKMQARKNNGEYGESMKNASY